MTTVRVGRSALRMWLFALAGIPFVVIGSDFLARRRIYDWFIMLIYDERTPDAFEARDTLWAVLFLIGGLLLIGFGLKELLFPRPVLLADETTTRWALRGPARPLVEVPWSSIVNWSAVTVDDAGERLPALLLELVDRAGLPEQPWGARWSGDSNLIILSEHWEQSAEVVASALRELATGRIQSRP